MIPDETHWDEVHKRLLEEKADEGHSHYAEEKENLFPRNSLVAELGGGTGADAVYFLKKGHSVILLDISSFALTVAKKRAGDVGLSEKLVTRQMDFGMHDFPLKDESVDIAYSRISLNYFGEQHTAKVFKDVYRILRKGGAAYITLKSPDDEEEMEFLKDNAVLYEPEVYIQGNQLRSRFSADHLTKILHGAGIMNASVSPYEEELSEHKEGHHPVLFTNEVSFTKE
jgi:ubiquinone/menaquinone biosynthesis C-methylase UbiE